MASGSKPNPNPNPIAKGRKRKYLPRGKPVRKGAYPLRPGVQGFFITCDGGRERQAAREAISLLDTFYEELVDGKGSDQKSICVPDRPLNKIIKFKDSDSSSDEDEGHSGEEPADGNNFEKREHVPSAKNQEEVGPCEIAQQDDKKQGDMSDESKSKKQRVEDPAACERIISKQSIEKPIDDLIDEELKELGDRKKRLFVGLDSGCNGVIFIQMHKRDGDPGPVDIVQHMMSSAASTRKHMSRFILRVLPAEVTCYASEEEITRAINPLVEHYFPKDSPSARKFAVLYEARSNTGIDRMKIINAVAKSVPQPHKVDLNNPDKTIIVQIAKTICLIGVAERYKELSKFNVRQLTSPQK